MQKKDILTKILAIVGTVLVWFPILAPFLFFFGGLLRDAGRQDPRSAGKLIITSEMLRKVGAGGYLPAPTPLYFQRGATH